MGSFTPFAFALHGTPEAEIIAESSDAAGRPIAIAWRQGSFVSFGPAYDPSEFDPGWRELFLECVSAAVHSKDESRGLPLMPDAPGLGAVEALAFELALAEPNNERLVQLTGSGDFVGSPLAASFAAERWKFVVGASGRVEYSADLATSDCGRLDGEQFLACLVTQLEAESFEIRQHARRLLARHAPDGPGQHATPLEWRDWTGSWGGSLLYAPASQTWQPDWDTVYGRPEPRSVVRNGQPRPSPYIPSTDDLIEQLFASKGVWFTDASQIRAQARIDLEWLKENRRPQARKVLIRMIAHEKSERERWQLLGDLAELGTAGARAALEILEQLMASEYSQLSEQAVVAASWTFDELWPLLRAWIEPAADSEGDASVRFENALDILLRSPSQRCLDASILEWTRGDPAIATRIAPLLGDSEAPVLRRRAGELLQSDPGAEDPTLRWMQRAVAFQLASPYLERTGMIPALLEATDSPDPWVAGLTTWSLRFEPSERATIQHVRRLASDGRSVDVRAIAAEALVRIDPPLGFRFEHCLAALPALRTGPFRGRLRRLPSEERAADLWAEIEARGPELLAAARSGEPAATAQVQQFEHRLGSWIGALCELMDDEFMPGPATHVLSGLGQPALPELSHEFMRPYRFPIGPGTTYLNLMAAAQEIGPDAWPIAVGACHHWRNHGLADAAPLFEHLAERRSTVAPFLAMSFAHRAGRSAGFVEQLRASPESRDSRYYSDIDGWLRAWRGLGAAGEPYLAELATHPDPRVADAAVALQERLAE